MSRWSRSRRSGVRSFRRALTLFRADPCPEERDKAAIEEGGDLLVVNSNHTGGAWRPHHSDDEEDESSEEEVDEDSDFEVDALGNRIETSL